MNVSTFSQIRVIVIYKQERNMQKIVEVVERGGKNEYFQFG